MKFWVRFDIDLTTSTWNEFYNLKIYRKEDLVVSFPGLHLYALSAKKGWHV